MTKESSGLLMNVIGTLSSLSSNEQRDHEKAKLEHEFKASDQRLEKLVSTHHKDMASAMQIYSKAVSRISEAHTKIATVKGQLAACRRLLHCRRDEIKKLWLEGIEHKEVLLMLKQIEELKELPKTINDSISKKDYFTAACLVVRAKDSLQGPLQHVEGLKDVKSDLVTKQELFYKRLVEELCFVIYTKVPNDVLQFRRLSNSCQVPFNRASSGRNSSGRGSGKMIKAEALKTKSLMLEITVHNQRSLDDQAYQCVNNIIKCLSLLSKLPEAIEHLKNTMGKELALITKKTAQQICENYPVGNKSVLKELFEAVIEQMKRIVEVHLVLLESVKNCLEGDATAGELVLYTKEDIWSQVQTAIQVMLSLYWDIGHPSNANNSNPNSSFGSQLTNTNINTFFSKKKIQRVTRNSLFRFESSLHSISLGDSSNETANIDSNESEVSSDKIIIVEPNARRVIEIYQPLMKFVQDIEAAIGSQCALHVFITVFTRDVFLSQIHIEMGNALDEATRKLDMWKTISSSESLHNLKANRPILQSTVQVYRCLMELRQLMEAVPQFSQHFLGMVCNILLRYNETCQAAYRELVQPESEEKRVISATWAKDEDIHRFLRSLPNWSALQDVRVNRSSGRNVGETYEDSPEEIRQRSAKETEILTGNLGDAIISSQEILSNTSQMRNLALLQESLEWFAAHIKEFSNVTSNLGSYESQAESNVQTLLELAKDFKDLADTCLLVLHLEVRVHCFYYMVPLGKQGQFWLNGENQEPDPEIGLLVRDLILIDESLSGFLQPRKHRYIFEGLSHLIASIVMASVQHIRRMNENGVKKMCRNIFSLQQTLASITLSREPALDHARQYFELLCLTPEEILNGILERGSSYTELEYIQVLQLLNRSRPGTASSAVTKHLERLSEILGELGVTV